MITVRCWGHIDPAKRHYTAEHTETHSFTAAQAVWLLEQMSDGDWEDGPRCLRELVDSMPPKHSVDPGGWRPLPQPEPDVYIPGTQPGPARHVVLGDPRTYLDRADIADAGTGGPC